MGSDVTHLKIGDKVCIEPGIPCLKCEIFTVGWSKILWNAFEKYAYS